MFVWEREREGEREGRANKQGLNLNFIRIILLANADAKIRSPRVGFLKGRGWAIHIKRNPEISLLCQDADKWHKKKKKKY